jgi:hypothetical protein
MKPTDKLVPDGDSAHDIVVALHEEVLDLELRTKHFILYKSCYKSLLNYSVFSGNSAAFSECNLNYFE